MPVAVAPPEEKVQLHNISWETYERLLAEHPNACGTRFSYNQGELEIMVVYIGHERPNRVLAEIVLITAEETGRNFSFAGSTTFKRQDLAKGFEPDSSFYFRHADTVRDKDEIDLAVDPPPELVIEVDITRSSLNRFPIFAGIGVSEVWRYDGERVHFYALDGTAYRPIELSELLPPMTAAQATVFVQLERQKQMIPWLRTVREWIRARC